MKKIFYGFIFYSSCFAQLYYKISPELSINSYSIPFEIKTRLSNKLNLHHQSLFFNNNHQFDRHLWYDYNQKNLVFISDISFLEYNDSSFSIKFGRDYLDDGNKSKVFGLKDAPFSPSLDHLNLFIKNSKYFHLKNRIVRLDNRKIYYDNEELIVNRWYYLKEMEFNISLNSTFSIYEGVMSTGIDRGLEWYYLYPLSSYIMEHKHEISRYDGQDSTYIIGKGDNDNHFTGLSFKLLRNKYKIYSEIFIDEWQLDKETRDNMQTIFGYLISVTYAPDNFNKFTFEFALASPWLYLNRATFGTFEKHYQPLGLKDPKSAYYGFLFERNIKNKKLRIMLRKQYKSNQNMLTKWDAWDNKIEILQFENPVDFESFIEYKNIEGKYFNSLGISHNLFGSKNTTFFISKDVKFKI
jgi:hypothetical protein